MRTGIALGANVGNPIKQLQNAAATLRLLADPDAPFLASSIYQTSPIDCPPDSPDFFNAVVEMEWSNSPQELLRTLHKLEIDAGRPAIRPTNAPRPLDLDILYCDDMTLNTPDLTLPHPRILERLFVLEPLHEIVPKRILPGCIESVEQILLDKNNKIFEVAMNKSDFKLLY